MSHCSWKLVKQLSCVFFEQATPPEFTEIYSHIRSLPYEQIPDYELLIHLCLKMLRDAGAGFDYQYDWLHGKESAGVHEQTERKKLIIRRLVPKTVLPYLFLQTHRVQFIQDESDATDADVEGTTGTAQTSAEEIEHWIHRPANSCCRIAGVEIPKTSCLAKFSRWG